MVNMTDAQNDVLEGAIGYLNGTKTREQLEVRVRMLLVGRERIACEELLKFIARTAEQDRFQPEHALHRIKNAIRDHEAAHAAVQEPK